MGRTWGRLYLGTRNHRKIKTLRRRHPGSWKAFYVLLEMAIEVDDDGWIHLAPGIPYPINELADEADETPETLQALLETMLDLGLIQQSDQGIRFPSYSERQFKSDVDGADRVRRHRAAQKANQMEPLQNHPTNAPTDCNGDVTLQKRYCNDDVTPSETDTDPDTDFISTSSRIKDQTRIKGNSPVFAASPTATPRVRGSEGFEEEVVEKADIGEKSNGSGKSEKSNPTIKKAKGPSKGKGPTYDPDFLTWWAEYPRIRRTDKLAAHQKWLALKKSGHLLPLSKMLAVLQAQKNSPEWLKDGGQFIPGPHPYLNKGRFLDESLAEAGAAGPSPPQHDPECPKCRGQGYYEVRRSDGVTAMALCNCRGDKQQWQ